MEHYRSIFTTAAVMVFGLVATSPLIREQNSGPSRTQSAAVDTMPSGSGDGWTDPPRQKVVLAAVTDAAKSRRDDLEGIPVPKPASFTLLSSETAALLAADDFAKSESAQRVQAMRRHRAAKVATRTRPAPVAESPATDTPAPEAAATQPQKAARIDPIGDILRGLGIGRDS